MVFKMMGVIHLKRLILTVLMLSMISTVAHAYSDITDESLSSKLNVLSEYSIINGYEDGTFRPDNNITRAEFCKLIICATMNDYISTYETSFKDVSEEFWGKKYIYAAKTLGIVNGTTENTFDPEANITNEQAIKMIVCSLGYGDEAVSAGGYPDGYIKVAEDLGIVSNDGFHAEAVSTRQEIAEMVYNALDTELYFIYLTEEGLVERSKADNTLREIHELSISESDDEFQDDVTDDNNSVG